MSCCGGSGVTGLCGTCGCTPCCCNYRVTVNTGGSGSPATAGQCVNLSGVCVLDAYTSNTMFFRGVASGTPVLTVSLDATNHVILLNLDINALAAALPQATTTQAGVGETATDAEAQGKASTTVFVTPSNFAAMGSSTTFAGLIEIATDAEAIAGASTTLAITPANLTAVIATAPNRQTFADAVGRNGATPLFLGQEGYQLDTGQLYVGYGLAAGFWRAVITDGITNDITGFSITSGAITLFAPIQFNTGCNVDFFGSVIQSGGVTVPADSVLLTSSTPGSLDSRIIANFASTVNTDPGWTGFTNSLVRKTCDCNTVTTAQLAQIVDTLINILATPLLPTP